MTDSVSAGHYDLICVGGGLGGLAAAAAAARLGARCLVLEATDRLGGVAAYSGGSVWMPFNHLQEADPELGDSESEVARYLAYIGCHGVPVDEALRGAYLTEGPRILREHAAAGVEFELATSGDYYAGAPGHRAHGRTLEARMHRSHLGRYADRLRETPYDWGRAALPSGEDIEASTDELTRGPGLVGSFLRVATADDTDGSVELRYSARVQRLLVETGRVVGVAWTVEGHECIAYAGGVLLATSGYGSAPWAAQMEGLVEYGEQAPPVAYGDGLRLAADVGAQVLRAGNGFFSVGFLSRRETHPGTDQPLYLPMVASLAFPHCMVVNVEGRRFADESFSGTFQSCLREYDDEAKGFRNQPFFFVCDDQYRRNGYRILGTDRVWPEAEFTRAGSLRELGDVLGFDGTAAEQTAARFSEFARAGVDADFGRGKQAFVSALSDPRYHNPMLGEISRPPFWGVRLVPVGAGICSHGLHIDECARVLRWSGEPVPGLYATGNAVAYTELPYGYQNGFANGRNIVYATLALEHALSAAVVPHERS